MFAFSHHKKIQRAIVPLKVTVLTWSLAHKSLSFSHHKKIWRSIMPLKVKLFMWSLTRRSSTTNDVFQRRRPNHNLCPQCCIIVAGMRNHWIALSSGFGSMESRISTGRYFLSAPGFLITTSFDQLQGFWIYVTRNRQYLVIYQLVHSFRNIVQFHFETVHVVIQAILKVFPTYS